MEMSGDMKALKIDRLSDIRKLFQRTVVPTYARFDLALDHGDGSYVFDVAGKRYLDLGGGIAVCALGHANPEITDALLEQSRKLLHVSNLYFTKPQAQLAEALVKLIGPGRCFFCNSGAEANEGLYKLARKFGHDEGRYEVLTTDGSFRNGRTLAGIAATGQEKVKKGFEGRWWPDFGRCRSMIWRRCAPRSHRKLPRLLVRINPGRERNHRGDSRSIFLVYENSATSADSCCFWMKFRPEAISEPDVSTAGSESWRMGWGIFNPTPSRWRNRSAADFRSGPSGYAKNIPISFRVGRTRRLSAAIPLGCAVALKVLEVIERDQLAQNARELGRFIIGELQRLIRKFPSVLKEVRGFGLMIGLEFRTDAPGFSGSEKAASLQVVERLHAAGVLTVPAKGRRLSGFYRL